MAFQTINPLDNSLQSTFNAHGTEDIEKTLTKGWDAFKSWKALPISERAKYLKKCGEVLRSNKRQYALLMTFEMGKVSREAEGEIEKCAWACDYFAENGEDFLAETPLPVDEGEAYIAYEPLGIILAIMPWNFPFWQVFRFAAPTLMAGNTAILKHAPNVPQCARAIEDVFIQAGLPEGVFQNLFMETDQVPAVIEDERVKAATLTGSELAGSKVAAQAGANIKKTVLELGGSDPFLVLKDADIEKAAKTAVKSRMINSGQSCIAAKRFIVEKPVAERFQQIFLETLGNYKQGNPAEEGVDYGPLAREDLAEKLERQVNKSIQKGAKALTGGGRPGKPGAFFNATVLTNVKPGMPAYEEELFGPVAVIFTVENEEEAIKIANDTNFGLGSSLWTNDKARAKSIARKIEAGNVYINDLVASNPRVPFGGIKHSGYGRELSFTGIKEFVNQKTVWVK